MLTAQQFLLTKREEGVAGKSSSLGLLSGLPEGDPQALQPVRLPTAHAQHAIVLHTNHASGTGSNKLSSDFILIAEQRKAYVHY